MTKSVVLFGAGSPLIVDYEETCERLGITIASIIRNIDCQDMASDTGKIIAVADMPRDLLALPFAIPLFSPANRRSAHLHAAALGATSFATLIDPTSILPRHLDVGQGVFVNAGAVIGAYSSLSEFSLVNRGTVLGHHLRLGAFSSIGPGAVVAGQVTIEDDALIGAGATILPGVHIGDHAVVGAGSVVTRDVAPFSVVMGSPARVVRTLDNG